MAITKLSFVSDVVRAGTGEKLHIYISMYLYGLNVITTVRSRDMLYQNVCGYVCNNRIMASIIVASLRGSLDCVRIGCTTSYGPDNGRH